MSPTLRHTLRRGTTLLLVAGAMPLLGCILAGRITGQVHDVSIRVDAKECRIDVSVPRRDCPADAPRDAVCVRPGDGVHWVAPEKQVFKIHLDPFGKPSASNRWYAPTRNTLKRAARQRPELEGAGQITFKYTVTLTAEGCGNLHLDPHIVVMY